MTTKRLTYIEKNGKKTAVVMELVSQKIFVAENYDENNPSSSHKVLHRDFSRFGGRMLSEYVGIYRQFVEVLMGLRTDNRQLGLTIIAEMEKARAIAMSKIQKY